LLLSPISVQSNQINHLANGTNSDDAAALKQVGSVLVLTDIGSDNVNVDFTLAPYQIVTLTGNSLVYLANCLPGQICTLEIVQDATGSRVPNIAGGTVRWAGGVVPTWSTVAGKADLVTVRGDGLGNWFLHAEIGY
jgi:hypothetical protein